MRRFHSTLPFFLFMWVLLFSACNKKQKCGTGKYKNGKLNFYICDSMLACDTIEPGDERWIGETDMTGIGWIGEFDTIQFYLPDGYTIAEARQAFLITPSLWAKEDDPVVQYITFGSLRTYCPNPKPIEHQKNMFVTPVAIEEDLMQELFFKNKEDIWKSELEEVIQSLYGKLDEEYKSTTPDEFTTASDINERIKENQREWKIYASYLNNYTNWHKAPRKQFELLATTRYLTLSVKTKSELKKITFVYSPVYGN
jgi:hypothetical protein